MSNQQQFKDPNALVDYVVDWTSWLGSDDTIATSTWLPDTGITVAAQSKTTTKATVWLAGGTAGQQYRVTNRITTTAGRTDDRSLFITVEER